MSRKYKFHNKESAYFISYSVVYWIDVFTRNEYKDILLAEWKDCIKRKGLQVHAWCIMTSHVHMIISSMDRPLEKIVGEMKGMTSKRLKESISQNITESRREWMLWLMERAGRKNSNNKEFQFWQQDNHPIELTDNFMIQQKLDYIHNNPVTAGYVDSPEKYLYSSAVDYAGGKGLLAELSIVE